MRVTKRMLREHKNNLMKRLKILGEMTDQEFVDEALRVTQEMGVKIPSTTSYREMFSLLARDYLDRSLPNHYFD